MKVILIDPSNQTVTEQNLEKGLQPIYDMIGNECDMFESPIDLDNGDSLMCDEEGLFHENIGGIIDINNSWSFPIVGKTIVTRYDRDGNSVNCESTIEDIKKLFVFLHKEDLESYFKRFN